MTRTFTYETTYESVDSDGAVTREVELRFTYTYRPATPDYYDKSVGGPGGWSPGDGGELEIVKVENEIDSQEKHWMRCDDHWTPIFADWAYAEHHDAMVEHASQPEDEG